MKNNKGFIATGLIYSFFLIFLTLFLSVITNHIKNKMSLSYVIDEIKSELNSHKTIRDFTPGDMINIVDDCNTIDATTNNLFIVANVVSNNNSKCDGINSECLILYSFSLYDNTISNPLTIDYIKEDISTGFLNESYINKIIYTFDNTNYKSYKLDENKYATLENEQCLEEEKIYCTDTGKINSIGNEKYRKRQIKTFLENKVEICHGIEDAMGVIYVKE